MTVTKLDEDFRCRINWNKIVDFATARSDKNMTSIRRLIYSENRDTTLKYLVYLVSVSQIYLVDELLANVIPSDIIDDIRAIINTIIN